ncbi:GM23714 [Drosophila sechellia]|uniref:GM23714 n=1 Tax=Drosophila sechellia TaxID=7238 RepID=B4HLN3_DROSE|nr:GM23714 [Drosophila sechellia]
MKDKRITAGASQLRRSPQILIGSIVGKTTPPSSNCRIKVGDKNRSDMLRSNRGRYAHKEHGVDVPSLSRMITISRQSMTKRRHNRRFIPIQLALSCAFWKLLHISCIPIDGQVAFMHIDMKEVARYQRNDANELELRYWRYWFRRYVGPM